MSLNEFCLRKLLVVANGGDFALLESLFELVDGGWHAIVYIEEIFPPI